MRQISMESFVGELEAQAVGGLNAAEVESYMRQTSVEPATLDRYITFRSDEPCHSISTPSLIRSATSMI